MLSPVRPGRGRRRLAVLLAFVAGSALVAACGGDGGEGGGGNEGDVFGGSDDTGATPSSADEPPEPLNIYAPTGADDLHESVEDIPSRVYVPNSESDTVDVIDPTTFEIIDSFPVGDLPQHVVPAYDMQTLYVNNNRGNTLTPIDPRTGQPGADIPINDPYNLYFTPDGTRAVVIAERESGIDFYDPESWEFIQRVEVPAEYRDPDGSSGVNHAEFTADGRYMILSCEFSEWLIRLDLESLEVTGALEIGGKPVDVRLSPDGSVVYNANETRNGVSIVDWETMTELAFLPTAAGAHGLYPSRDGTQLYISNRMAGSVSVLDFATNQIVGTWTTGGSPDMGGVSIDGTQLWLSGRYDSEVYVIDTTTGELITTIPVGNGPHGLAVFPQPGSFSTGHTGNHR